jgi:hypothetical protein
MIRRSSPPDAARGFARRWGIPPALVALAAAAGCGGEAERPMTKGEPESAAASVDYPLGKPATKRAAAVEKKIEAARNRDGSPDK